MVEKNQLVEFLTDFVTTNVNSSFFCKVTESDLTITLCYNFNQQEDMVFFNYDVIQMFIKVEKHFL